MNTETAPLHPALRAFRWTALAAVIASGLLSSATILTLAIVSLRCQELTPYAQHVPYISMAAWFVMPWIAAAALQRFSFNWPGPSLDIWRAAALAAVYFHVDIHWPFLETFAPYAIAIGARCPIDPMSYLFMHRDFYDHDSLRHLIAPLLLLLTLLAALILGGCLKVISFAADYASRKMTRSEELADP